MKIDANKVAVALAIAGLAGCFTVSESEYPQVAMSPLPASLANRTVAVRGFDATVTDFTVIDGMSTVYVPGYGGRRHWSSGGYQIVHTTTTVPQVRATSAYLEQAKNRFEAAGFVTMAQTPDYIVEGSFCGPFADDGTRAWRFVRNLFSVFTCDKSSATWRGTLKVYDNRTGKLVLRREYDQLREVSVFSPIPLFGISQCSVTGYGRMQTWCLAALTDRMAAEATAFLAAPEIPSK